MFPLRFQRTGLDAVSPFNFNLRLGLVDDVVHAGQGRAGQGREYVPLDLSKNYQESNRSTKSTHFMSTRDLNSEPQRQAL